LNLKVDRSVSLKEKQQWVDKAIMALIKYAIALIIVAIWIQSSHAGLSYPDKCQGDNYGDAGDFDLYVLQQTWPAKYCDSDQGRACQQPTPYMRVNMTIHGYWPTYSSSRSGNKWPQCCGTLQGVQMLDSVFHPLAARLRQLWPDFKRPNANSAANTIWDYEWGKHGTCADITQLDYFHATLDTADMLGTTATVMSRGRSGNSGAVQRNDLESHYSGGGPCTPNQPCKVVLECEGGDLASVNTCWNKNHKRISCPVSFIQSKSRGKCPASIRILSF